MNAVATDHFEHPRHAGPFPAGETGVLSGSAGRAGEGLQVAFHLKFAGESIAAARFQAFGCGYAIAAASWTAEWLTGRAVGEARSLGASEIVAALDFPAEKRRSAETVAEALGRALGHHLA